MPITPAHPPQMGLSTINKPAMMATQVFTVESNRNNNWMNTQLTSQTIMTGHSRTPQLPQSKFSKQDFEMGYIIKSKGDRELVYIARKKSVQVDQQLDILQADSDTVSNSNSTIPGISAAVITTVREITKKRLDQRQIKQLKDSATFLSQHRHENLLEVWGLFWDEKKVYFILEPATRQVQLIQMSRDTETSQQVHNETSADFIKEFPWQETICDGESENFQYKYTEPEDKRLRDEQDFLRRQLYRYTSQLIDLYKYFLDEHGLKNVHIKPYNILDSGR